MSQEFEKWISSKKFEILDQIKCGSNKDIKCNDFIVLNDNLLSSSDIKVFHSKKEIIESIVANKPNECLLSNSNDVLKWFNDIRHRKPVLQRFSDLLMKSTKILEFLETVLLNTSAKVSESRGKNLMKSFNYGINYQIFNYDNEIKATNIGYSVIKIFGLQSFLLKVINELIPCLVAGIPVLMIVEDKIAIIASYLLDLLSKSGLESKIIQLVIIDGKNGEKLRETTEPTIASKFIFFESADIESGINRLISSYINDTIGSIHVFVQQSIYTKFCERMKTISKNSLKIGDRFDPNVDIISKINVNYEAIDFDNEDKTFDIQVFKFRTNEEMKNLVNHFTNIPFISLWAEKTSLALEFAQLVDCEDIYINTSVTFPVKKQISTSGKSMNKMEMNLFSDKNKLFESMITSNKKWKSTPEEEREQIINNFLLTNGHNLWSNAFFDSSNTKIDENKDQSGIRLKITDFEAIGLIVIKINEEFNQRIFGSILEALVSGNSVVVINDKPMESLNKLKEYLSSLGQNIFNSIDLIELKIKENTSLMIGSKPVGLYLQQFENISRKSFVRFKKTITLSMGDISYAK